MRHFHHLTFTDRLRIETLTKAAVKPKEIAVQLGVSDATVYRELKRGRYTHLNKDYIFEDQYSPDIAEEKYQENLKAKGSGLKIGHDHRLADFIERKVKDGYSPGALIGEIKVQGLEFDTSICTRTVYNYIDNGVFLNITNKDLPYRPTGEKRGYRKVRPAKSPRGESIEHRPAEVNDRQEFGHWEMDCVIGKKGTKGVLLVLTERYSRKELIIPMRDKTSASVVRALDRLERQYGSKFYDIFKTITVDNGTEFSDCAGIEQAKRRKGKRTILYYCHPYTSCERGSNENQNRIIRRFIPKGRNIGELKRSVIQGVEDWMNRYPRKIFGFLSAEDVYQDCLSKLFG